MSLQTIDYRKPILAATYGACMGHRKYVNLPEGAWFGMDFDFSGFAKKRGI